MQKRIRIVSVSIILVICIVACIGGLWISKADELNNSEAVVTSEGSTAQTVNTEETSNNKGIGMIAAALAIGLAAIGSGIAVAVVASSAVGAISENPSLLGKTVIFAGLAEGIAIYGLIIAIMILSKV